jgi:large subunit ribosomal protein L17
MRHRKHNHLLGVKTAHRTSLIANLSCSLIENGRIKTTLAKARALRPAIEKAITLAKKARATDDLAKKLHYRRQAIARLRSKLAVKKLFDELVDQFAGRNGGYTRIYKLAIPRLGDAAEMGIIEFVEELQKKKAKKKRSSAKTKSTKSNAEDKTTEEDIKSSDPKPSDVEDSSSEPEEKKDIEKNSSKSEKSNSDDKDNAPVIDNAGKEADTSKKNSETKDPSDSDSQ